MVMNPRSAGPRAVYAHALTLLGRYDEARVAAARASADRGVARLRAEFRDGRSSGYLGALHDFAAVATLTGTRDSALAWLGEVRASPSSFTPAFLRLTSTFAWLRGDPRFEAWLTPPAGWTPNAARQP